VRDVRYKAHLAPGQRVKIVRPKDEATGVTTEGILAEVVSKEDFVPEGVIVRLQTGEEGRVLRVWAPPLERPRDEGLPTYVQPKPTPARFQHRLPDDEVEKKAAEVLGEADIDFMIEQKAQGFQGNALREYGIRSEELAEKTRELLSEVDDEELERRMGGREIEERDDDGREP
jgi:uncharacterized repeat protein (TIGR03833 family)